jgi:micrococcal nuclease
MGCCCPKPGPDLKTAIAKAPIPPPTCTAYIASVYDGDTFTAHVDMGAGMGVCKYRCRLAHVDTPEMRGGTPASRAAAVAARDYVRATIERKTITLFVDRKVDKYGRLLVTVPLAGGTDLGRVLITQRHAVPYEGGTKAKIPTP